MIEIEKCSKSDRQSVLDSGKGIEFYWLDGYDKLIHYKEKYDCDVYYTERQGDCIALLVPKGTKESELPRMAIDWIAFKWNPIG